MSDPNHQIAFQLGEQIDVDAVITYAVAEQINTDYLFVYLYDISSKRFYRSHDTTIMFDEEAPRSLMAMTHSVFARFRKNRARIENSVPPSKVEQR